MPEDHFTLLKRKAALTDMNLKRSSIHSMLIRFIVMTAAVLLFSVAAVAQAAFPDPMGPAQLGYDTEVIGKNVSFRPAQNTNVRAATPQLPTAEGTASEGNRRLTVLVYLCGSNLESNYGSASADLREMMQADFDDEELALLVMTGGSESWKNGLDAGEISILQIASGRQRILQRNRPRSMGAAETLRDFLCYAKEEFPAEDYALILWDHGAGPLEGVCWDELFSLDRLTLSELTEALEAAALPRRLKWIGFDACLMGEAEVAHALAPWAEYMIASQETEPAAGWDYSFLKDAATDATGADTGRRIVDAYFESQAGSRDRLTLSCVDLGQMEALAAELDRFFEPIGSRVDAETFSRISGIRFAAGGFGEIVRAVGDEGYDLVDLRELIAGMEGDGETLLQALERAVVYSRSSGVDASGLSVYHPYTNKTRFSRDWGENYRRLNFSPGYQKYVDRFGAFLTGKMLISWAGLLTVEEAAEQPDAHRFTLALSEAQREALVSAELLILERVHPDWEQYFSLSPVYAAPAVLDGDHLTGTYAHQALYVTDGEGKVLTGPISFLTSEDGSSMYVLCMYEDYSARSDAKNDTAVLYELEPDGAEGELKRIRTFVYDKITGSYTNRIPFTEEGYTDLEFHFFIRNMPQTEGEIPGFDSWDPYRGYRAWGISLPEDWHLLFFDHWQGRELYAMFQLTDAQQNMYSSQPIRISNPYEKDVAVSPADLEINGLRLTFSVIRDEAGLQPSVRFRLEAENTTDTDLNVSSGGIVVNGDRRTSASLLISPVPSGGVGKNTETLPAEELAGLQELTCLDFTLSVRPEEDDFADPVEVPVHLEILNGSLTGIVEEMPSPLAEAESEGITWKLLSLTQNVEGEFEGLLFLRNDGEEPVDCGAMMLMNGVRVGNVTEYTLDAGEERVSRFTASNRDNVSSFSLRASDWDGLYLLGVLQAAEQAGVEKVTEIDLYRGMRDLDGAEGVPVRMTLAEPLPLRERKSVPEGVSLLEGCDVQVTLESAIVADDGVGLGLRLKNVGDETVYIRMIRPSLNGGKDSAFDFNDGVVLPAGTSAVKCLVFSEWKTDYTDMTAETLRFFFRIGNQVSTPAELAFPEGTLFGMPRGTIFSGAELTVRPAAMEETPMAISEKILLPAEPVLPVPVTAPLTAEEAEGVESVTAWISLLGMETVSAEDETGQIQMPEEDRMLFTHRNIAGTLLQRNSEGRWTGTFSGLMVTLQEGILQTSEESISDDCWRLTPDTIYLYTEETEITENQDLFFKTDYRFSSRGNMTVETGVTPPKVRESTLGLRNRVDLFDDRTNIALAEVKTGAYRNRVYFGTDRMAYVDTLDRYENQILDLSAPLVLSLEPLPAAEEALCVYYIVHFADGSREDILTEYPSGTVLERTHMDP